MYIYVIVTGGVYRNMYITVFFYKFVNVYTYFQRT